MAINDNQKTDSLFKKDQGKGATSTDRRFFEEPINARSIVFQEQIWTYSDLIPTTAPNLAIVSPPIYTSSGQDVLQYYIDLILQPVSGSPLAFYHNDLKDAVPFNFGDGSYNYVLKKNNDIVIPFGTNDWLVDPSAGTLVFYGGLPLGVSTVLPPKITFYRYIGGKGGGTGGGGSTTFTALTDTPNTYMTESGKIVTVNQSENGLEFSDNIDGGNF